MTLQRNEAKIEVNATRLIFSKTTRKNSHENSKVEYNCVHVVTVPKPKIITLTQRKLKKEGKKECILPINGLRSEVSKYNKILYFFTFVVEIYIETIENRDEKKNPTTTFGRDNNYSHFQSLRMSMNNKPGKEKKEITTLSSNV